MHPCDPRVDFYFLTSLRMLQDTDFSNDGDKGKGKGKAEHLYSALHGTNHF